MRGPVVIIVVGLVLALTSCVRSPESALEKRIQRVEHGLITAYGDPPWKTMRLAERMADYHVPGVSIAVINGLRVEWARGYGILETGHKRSVTPQTLFQAASVGKLVVAVAALHCVEEGVLTLDGDVNRSLLSWQVPESEFTATAKVTLRRLLSHSAGMTVAGFRGYAQGEEVPNLRQILAGKPPANSPPIRVDAVPGTLCRYSGGGYVVVQQLLEDAAGRPFPELMREIVLQPWGMLASTFESPLPEDLRAIAATGHRRDGTAIAGRWHTYPELGSGASLWATPSDLARFAIGIMLAHAGRSNAVLSQALTLQMLSREIGDRGLGPVLGDDGKDLFYFLHPGANEGFRAFLVAYPKRGQGVVIMTNGDNGEGLYREILRSVSREYGWVRDYTRLYVSIAVATGMAFLATWVLLRLRARRCSP